MGQWRIDYWFRHLFHFHWKCLEGFPTSIHFHFRNPERLIILTCFACSNKWVLIHVTENSPCLHLIVMRFNVEASEPQWSFFSFEVLIAVMCKRGLIILLFIHAMFIFILNVSIEQLLIKFMVLKMIFLLPWVSCDPHLQLFSGLA